MKNIKNANIYIALTLLYSMFLSTPILIIMRDRFGINDLWILQTVGSFLIFLVPFLAVYMLKMVRSKDIRDIIPFKKISIKNMICIYIMSILIQPLFTLIGNITNIFYEDEISDIILEFTKIPYLYSLIAVAITPALTEEFIFRGVFLTGYRNTKVWIAVLVSSILFGIIHSNITQLFYAITAGVFFAFLVNTTGSIWASVWSHFVINGTQITLIYSILSSKIYKFTVGTIEIPEPTQLDNIMTAVDSFIFFLISLPFLIISIKFFRKLNTK